MYFYSQIYFEETKITKSNVENRGNVRQGALYLTPPRYVDGFSVIGRGLLFALLSKSLSGNFQSSHSALITNGIIIIIIDCQQQHHHHHKNLLNVHDDQHNLL